MNPRTSSSSYQIKFIDCHMLINFCERMAELPINLTTILDASFA